jgi:hypothetical protein
LRLDHRHRQSHDSVGRIVDGGASASAAAIRMTIKP